MQTETLEKSTPIFTDFPPALPPAAESQNKTQKKKRRLRAGILMRAVCLLTSLSVLTLCTVQKVNEILAVGIVNYISGELIGISADAIGENVNASPQVHQKETPPIGWCLVLAWGDSKI